MLKIRGLRWWMIVLIMLGSIVNYLTRSTLAVAAPTVLKDLHITTQQYSWIVAAFQGAIMAQPICGYVLDVLGLKLGFAIFAVAWSLVNMAHCFANSWQAFAWLRGLLGFSEGSANPAGMKATAEWFPARERGLAGGVYNIGASVGSMVAPPLVAWAILSYNWRAAFVITGSLGLAWVVLWLLFYQSPARHPALSEEEKNYISSGQEKHLQSDGSRPSVVKILGQRNFWGIALPRFLADPTWGTLSFCLPLYLSSVRHMDLRQIAMFAWLPFLAADFGCLFGGLVAMTLQKRAGLSVVDARRCAFTLGAFLMLGVGFVGFVESSYAAIALLSLGGFAHQTLSVTVITMSSDLFRKNEVATAAGMAGTFGNAGLLIFSLLIGGLVATVGYTPFFVCLGVLDLFGAVVLWSLVREQPSGKNLKMPDHTSRIHNPILPGFNPDPSILRVDSDYYIATSTFEWYPGVQIHHSRDLVHWRLLTRPLTRASQLNMLGDPDSCGIWAPCLSYAEGLFYLIYTDVKRYGRTTQGAGAGASLRDTHNNLVTSTQIVGEWSDPVYLNSSGFDPSLFHDDDGRKYLLNMVWDHRPGHNRFSGIALQEYSPTERKVVGQPHLIFEGTSLGFTEGPHLYKRLGYYYLLTAEGGTGWGHAVTMARSRALTGPYELHPDGYLLTSRHRPDIELQRAGHADLVETQTGETYMVHLCGRPIRNRGRCTLGRETAIQPMVWCADSWLRTADGQGVPYSEVAAPALPIHVFPASSAREDFDTPELPLDFQWLRSPWPAELFSLTERPGHLRLYGRETLGSLFRQALVARRQQSHCFSAATLMDFEPEQFQQMAGLVCYYNGSKFHYLYISHDATSGRHIRVMSCLPDQLQSDVFTPPIAIPSGVPVHLRVEVDYERLHFGYRVDGQDWCWLSGQLDASILSDEAAAPGTPNFTGAFVGMCCQDVAGTHRPADFDYFEYRERGYLADPRKVEAI